MSVAPRRFSGVRIPSSIPLPRGVNTLLWREATRTAVRLSHELSTGRKSPRLDSLSRSMVDSLVRLKLINAVEIAENPNKATTSYHLSARELQIVSAMADGKTNAEIASELHITIDTVKTHAQRLYRKMGASDRANAVAISFRGGHLR